MKKIRRATKGGCDSKFFYRNKHNRILQINLLEFFLVTKPPLNFRTEMLSPFAVSQEHACTHANKEKQFVRKKNCLARNYFHAKTHS